MVGSKQRENDSDHLYHNHHLHYHEEEDKEQEKDAPPLFFCLVRLPQQDRWIQIRRMRRELVLDDTMAAIPTKIAEEEEERGYSFCSRRYRHKEKQKRIYRQQDGLFSVESGVGNHLVVASLDHPFVVRVVVLTRGFSPQLICLVDGWCFYFFFLVSCSFSSTSSNWRTKR